MTNSGREATAQYRADKAQSWGPWPICAGAALWRSRNMTESLSRTHRSRNRQACPHDRGVEGRGVRASITRYYIVMGCPVASLVGRPAFVARPASTTLGSTALRRWLRPDNAPALGTRVSPRRISSDRSPRPTSAGPQRRNPLLAPWWQTHGLPPPVGDRDRRHAAERIAATGGAGGHLRSWRGPRRLPRRLAGRRARRAVHPKPSACRSSRLGLAATPRPRRRLARPAVPQPPPPAPNVRPPRPGGQAPTFGVTGLAARPGRPRAAPRRTVLRPWPPCHGSRTVRPQPVRETWSTGAEVAGAPGWQARRRPSEGRRHGSAFAVS